MKIKTCLIVLSLFAIMFTCSPFASADSMPSNGINRKLTGVNILWISVIIDGNVPGRDILPAKIVRLCSEKIRKTGVEVTNDPVLCNWSAKSKIPVLKIRISILEANDLPVLVFHSKTSFSRTVSLDTGGEPIMYKADVWESLPVMESAAKDKLPDALPDAVLKQVDIFISAWQEANIPDPNAAAQGKTSAGRKTEPAAKQTSKGKFIASKNSDVFHKPGCPFAQNIAVKNIVDFNDCNEAIAAGKRPCKKCNPQ